MTTQVAKMRKRKSLSDIKPVFAVRDPVLLTRRPQPVGAPVVHRHSYRSTTLASDLKFWGSLENEGTCSSATFFRVLQNRQSTGIDRYFSGLRIKLGFRRMVDGVTARRQRGEPITSRFVVAYPVNSMKFWTIFVIRAQSTWQSTSAFREIRYHAARSG